MPGARNWMYLALCLSAYIIIDALILMDSTLQKQETEMWEFRCFCLTPVFQTIENETAGLKGIVHAQPAHSCFCDNSNQMTSDSLVCK